MIGGKAIKMSTRTKNDYLRPMPIGTGDLMKTYMKLGNLLEYPNIKGLLILSEVYEPFYVKMPEKMSPVHKTSAVRIVLALASFGNIFSHIQVVNNEANLPAQRTTINAHPDSERLLERDLHDRVLSQKIR